MPTRPQPAHDRTSFGKQVRDGDAGRRAEPDHRAAEADRIREHTPIVTALLERELGERDVVEHRRHKAEPERVSATTPPAGARPASSRRSSTRHSRKIVPRSVAGNTRQSGRRSGAATSSADPHRGAQERQAVRPGGEPQVARDIDRRSRAPGSRRRSPTRPQSTGTCSVSRRTIGDAAPAADGRPVCRTRRARRRPRRRRAARRRGLTPSIHIIVVVVSPTRCPSRRHSRLQPAPRCNRRGRGRGTRSRHRAADQRRGDVVEKARQHEHHHEQHETATPVVGQVIGQPGRHVALLEVPRQQREPHQQAEQVREHDPFDAAGDRAGRRTRRPSCESASTSQLVPITARQARRVATSSVRRCRSATPSSVAANSTNSNGSCAGGLDGARCAGSRHPCQAAAIRADRCARARRRAGSRAQSQHERVAIDIGAVRRNRLQRGPVAVRIEELARRGCVAQCLAHAGKPRVRAREQTTGATRRRDHPPRSAREPRDPCVPARPAAGAWRGYGARPREMLTKTAGQHLVARRPPRRRPCVPACVVWTTVRPRRSSASSSVGELPASKPGRRRRVALARPARRRARACAARARSSTSATGNTREAPASTAQASRRERAEHVDDDRRRRERPGRPQRDRAPRRSTRTRRAVDRHDARARDEIEIGGGRRRVGAHHATDDDVADLQVRQRRSSWITSMLSQVGPASTHG